MAAHLLGHEAGAIVLEVGPEVRHVKPGRRRLSLASRSWHRGRPVLMNGKAVKPAPSHLNGSPSFRNRVTVAAGHGL